MRGNKIGYRVLGTLFGSFSHGYGKVKSRSEPGSGFSGAGQLQNEGLVDHLQEEK